MRVFLMLSLITWVLGGCAYRYDDTHTQTTEFQAWVRANSGCSEQLKNNPNVSEHTYHSLDLQRQFYADSSGGEAGFVHGRVTDRSSCRVSRYPERTSVTRYSTPSSTRGNRAEQRPEFVGQTKQSAHPPVAVQEPSAPKLKLIPMFREERQRKPALEKPMLVPVIKPEPKEGPVVSDVPEEPASERQSPARSVPAPLVPTNQQDDAHDCITQPNGEKLCLK